jgi:Tol biopolymer transport system component
MKSLLRLLLGVMLTAGIAVTAPPAGARVHAANGRIAFCRYNPAIDDCDIVTANPDGSDEFLLRSGAEIPRWSPDGSQISISALTVDGRITTALVHPDGSGYTEEPLPDVTLNLECGTWRPDAVRLACEGWDDVNPGRQGVYTVRRSDWGDLVRLTTNDQGGHDISCDYSPDGGRILFLRENPPLHGVTALALFVMNVDGTGLHQLTPSGLAAGCARWSPDGTRLVFSDANNRPKGSIFLMDPDGGRLTKVRQFAGGSISFAPAWSPDGTRIVFALSAFPRQGGQDDLYSMNPDGTGLTQITNTPDFEESPDWGTYLG